MTIATLPPNCKPTWLTIQASLFMVRRSHAYLSSTNSFSRWASMRNKFAAAVVVAVVAAVVVVVEVVGVVVAVVVVVREAKSS